MDIVEFFDLSSGKWFSQRTSHDFAGKQSKGGKSDIQIKLLEQTDPAVIQLCEYYEIDATQALCGAQVTWKGTGEWDQKHEGSTVIVPIADLKKPNEGKILHGVGDAKKPPVAGRYIMGDDAALTLIIEDETTYSEERLWFASPNLRLRTSILKQLDGFSMASFCSEIRMGGIRPDPSAQSAAQSQT